MLSWGGLNTHRPSVPGITPVSSSSSPSAAPFPCRQETVSNFNIRWLQPWFNVKLLFAAADSGQIVTPSSIEVLLIIYSVSFLYVMVNASNFEDIQIRNCWESLFISAVREYKNCLITRIHYLFCRLQANIVVEVITCEPLICHICTPIWKVLPNKPECVTYTSLWCIYAAY